MFSRPYIDIESVADLPAAGPTGTVSHYVFQYIDFTCAPQYLAAGHLFSDCLFLGCTIPPEMGERIGSSCLIFPRMERKYHVFRKRLYSGDELYCGYDAENDTGMDTCFDSRVYENYIHNGKECYDLRETLGRSLHDHSISSAMSEFVNRYEEKQIVAVMGGHALLRTDEAFAKIARISKTLTEKGKLMCSGGGPGAMEATHFGAWMAGYGEEEFEDALAMLTPAPSFRDPQWLKSAFQVRAKYPQTHFRSLGIPTWLYGHEPATPFATDIAKYFMNSVREDILLTIAKGGIIYSPGSAGTLQEIFQDAAQNHYETFGYASPMIFFGKEFYTKQIPIYPLLEDLLGRGVYKNLILSLTDSEEEVVESLLSFK